MNNYALILLKDGRTILTTDIGWINNKELCYDVGTNSICQLLQEIGTNASPYILKIIGGIEPLPILSYSDKIKESLKNNHKWVDVEELGKNRAIERKWNPNSLETKRVANEIIQAVKFGYEAHQSITNKRFSLEDMKTAFLMGLVYAHKPYPQNKEFEEKYFQSLQKPIQLNVDIKVNKNNIEITKILIND